MRNRGGEPGDEAAFWLSFFYWGGLAGALTFSLYVAAISSSVWFPRPVAERLLTLVFQGTLLFVALAFLVPLLVRKRHREMANGGFTTLDREFMRVVEETVPALRVRWQLEERRGVTMAAMPSAVRRGLWYTMPLAATLIILGLSGTAALGPAWLVSPGASNGLIIFAILGLLILLFPGLGYLVVSAYRAAP